MPLETKKNQGHIVSTHTNPRVGGHDLSSDKKLNELLESVVSRIQDDIEVENPYEDISSPDKNRSPSSASRLEKLIESVVFDVKSYAEDQLRHIQQITRIGLALSSEKDINKLLELIVDEAKALYDADGGTLYILDSVKQQLQFVILKTDSMKTRIGGSNGSEIPFPDVPLFLNGEPNHSNVCTHVALTGESVNIPDVYTAEGFDFSGPRTYDKNSGYRSKSMLVMPMKNHENEIIGVLQLLNAQDKETGEVIEFSEDYADLIAALTSQAAVALTKTQLIEDLTNLFYSFIKSIATAIDEKSPYTGGHIRRVVDLSMMIAENINSATEGSFKDAYLDEIEMEELKMAAWMHDVGKITTPEHVVDKSTKLQTIFDRTHLIETRYNLIRKNIENAYLKKEIEYLNREEMSEEKRKQFKQQLEIELNTLREEMEFVQACNMPGEYMSDEKIERLRHIASKTFLFDGKPTPYLTDNELENLCIRKGSLTEEERLSIENHAKMTEQILGQLPFPRRMANVPAYAGSHHEKLDGSGYPHGFQNEDLPLQARILAIADVYEALTARDRPYKKPMKLSEAVRIMGFMKNDQHIDPDIHDLFINNQLHLRYAKKEMNPDQIDIPEARQDE